MMEENHSLETELRDQLEAAEARIAELELSLDVHYNKYLGEETKRIAAEARIAELERVLRMYEFTGDWDIDVCPWCRKVSNNKATVDKHAPDCPRQAVLNE
jgi:hypothetical protein